MRTVAVSARRGFTLIELLVVVAIIALLIAILLPSLSKAKFLANRSKCLGSAHGIAESLHLYINDFQKPMPYADVTTAASTDSFWSLFLVPYGAGPKIRGCPEAYLKNPSTGNPTKGAAHMPWANFGGTNDGGGAYGLNGWLYRGGNTTNLNTYSISTNTGNPMPNGSFFIDPLTTRETAAIPMLADACWPDGWPLADNVPPTAQLLQDGVSGGTKTSLMRRFSIDRHNRTVNVAFLDGHAENVKIQDLWTLKWHAQWVTVKPLPVIP